MEIEIVHIIFLIFYIDFHNILLYYLYATEKGNGAIVTGLAVAMVFLSGKRICKRR